MAAFRFWCVSGLSSLVSLCTNLVQSLGLKVKSLIQGNQGISRISQGLFRVIEAN